MAGKAKGNGRRRDPDASRQRLLRAGVKLFAAHGPHRASVDMISREARLNRRMIYHYFGSKTGLYRAVLRHAFDALTQVDVELAHMLLPAEELLERMIRQYYHFLASHPEVVRLLSWENLGLGRAAQALDMPSVKAPMIEALRLALSRGREEGRFREDIDEKQILISCMVLSFFYFSNRHTVSQALGYDMATPRAIEARIQHVVSLVLDGIRTR